ncbi:MAG: LamG-like jellyroll fold domain-containing protein, partial [Planctomycetota bacterium]
VDGGPAGRVEGGTDLITPGVWDAYALTFAGGVEFRMYKNGQLVQEKATNLGRFANTRHRLRLGRSGGSIGHLPASLDEVAVFDTVLDADDIKELHDVGRGQARLPEAGDHS